MAWTAIKSSVLGAKSSVSLMTGDVQWSVGFLMLLINSIGVCVVLLWLNRERPHLP